MTRSTQSYDWLLENTPQAVLIASATNEILACNKQATDMLGKTARRLTGKSLDLLFEDWGDLQTETPDLGFYPEGRSQQAQVSLMLSLRPQYGGRQVLASACRSRATNEQFVVTLTDMTPFGQACRLDIVFGEAYRELAQGTMEHQVLEDLCLGLADALQLPFIWVGQLDSEGNVQLLAASHSGPLKDELLKIPERRDECATGKGPAGIALREDSMGLLNITQVGLQPWRKAARSQGVQALAAWPMKVNQNRQGGHYVVSFGGNKAVLQDELNQQALASIVQRLRRFCRDAQASGQHNLVADAMVAAGNAAFITNPQGTIQWANQAFARLCGHPLEEVIGNNPRLLQSGKQGLRYYQRLWRTIQSGQVWSGETVERDRNGELYTVRQTISPVTANGRVQQYISIHEDISSDKAMQVARERARRRDDLTGLLTAASFEDRLTLAVGNSHRKGEPLALLLLALDGFSSMRQTMGSDIEGLLLETMGERIREELDEDDFAAFINEGDFVVVLRNIRSRKDAEALGQRLLGYVKEPLPLLGDQVYLDTRVGIALCPEDASNADALMLLADQRAAKTAGDRSN